MADKKIINDRQRARKVYGYVQRLPDRVYNAVGVAEGTVGMLSLDWKESVQFASNTNIPLPPPGAIYPVDSGTPGDGDRILLKGQSDSSENGIYVVNVAANTWSRADDAIPGSTLTCGAVVYVENGATNMGTKWILTTRNVTLGGSQTWVMFDRGNDWLVSGSGGQMKTSDPISIGGEFAKDIAADIFFYVSGSRRVGQPSLAEQNVSLFTGDVTISGTVDMTRSDGFWGDRMEVSGSFAVTTGSIAMQVAGTNDYVFFVDETGQVKIGNPGAVLDFTSIQPGIMATGSFGFGYDCAPDTSFYEFGISTAMGLRASTTRFAQFSHASSGFVSYDPTVGTRGEAQYSRVVWCGTATAIDTTMNFSGYSFLGLMPYFTLESGKSYAISVTAIIAEVGTPSNCAMFVRDILAHCESGTSTIVNINDTFTYQNGTTWDLDAQVDGFNSLIFHIDAGVGPTTFGVDVKGTLKIELTEILAT